MKKLEFVQYNAPVVLTFTLISLIALLLGNATDNATTFAIFAVYRSSFADPLFYLRLFGHVFGHINFGHFFNNFLILLLVGPILEEKYGSKHMVIMIAITAFVTGVVQLMFFNTALLGASGIVFMFMILASFVNMRRGRIPLTLILVVFIYLGREIHGEIFLDDNISRVTHIVGGVCGAIYGFVMDSKK